MLVEPGMPESGVCDELLDALIDGCCEEMDLADAASLRPLSLKCLRRMERVQVAARGQASTQVLRVIAEKGAG